MTRQDDARPDELPVIPRNFIVAIDEVEIGFCSPSRLSSEAVCEGPADVPPRIIHRFLNVVLRRARPRPPTLRLASGHPSRQARQAPGRHSPTYAAGWERKNVWVPERAWPCRWAGPAFDAGATEVAMEEIGLAFERLVWRRMADRR